MCWVCSAFNIRPWKLELKIRRSSKWIEIHLNGNEFIITLIRKTGATKMTMTRIIWKLFRVDRNFQFDKNSFYGFEYDDRIETVMAITNETRYYHFNGISSFCSKKKRTNPHECVSQSTSNDKILIKWSLLWLKSCNDRILWSKFIHYMLTARERERKKNAGNAELTTYLWCV